MHNLLTSMLPDRVPLRHQLHRSCRASRSGPAYPAVSNHKSDPNGLSEHRSIRGWIVPVEVLGADRVRTVASPLSEPAERVASIRHEVFYRRANSHCDNLGPVGRRCYRHSSTETHANYSRFSRHSPRSMSGSVEPVLIPCFDMAKAQIAQSVVTEVS